MDSQSGNVLIVDDISQNIQILGQILKSRSYNVFVATNGVSALKIATDRVIDLILLDVSMPEMDGYEVCKRLKANPVTAEIPVIFLTARIQPEDVIMGFESGGVDYVTKPFQADELLQRVATHTKIRLQQKLISEQNKQLIELNATKNKFFSIIAHDLKNPFSTILGYSSLLSQNFTSFSMEESLNFINSIFNSADNAYKLLENLLTWARTQSQTLTFEPEVINIKNMVNEVLLLNESFAAKKDITIINNITSDCHVLADKNMIHTVFRNLVSNAIKYTDKYGAVTVDFLRKPDEHLAVVSVVDTGIGIASDRLENLFRIDTNSTTPGTHNESGTGLGLILCYEFVVKNGGKIWVDSLVGRGSAFSFTVPLAVAGD